MMIFEKHGNLKYKFGNRPFCAEGYSVSPEGLNEGGHDQETDTGTEENDKAMERQRVRENEEPFKGSQ